MISAKILLWLKKNWHWIALGVGIVAMAIYLRQDFINDRALDTLINNMRETSEAHLKEIKRLEEINDKKEEELKLLNEEYNKKIDALKKEYKEALSDVETKTVVTKKNIIEEAYRDPNTLTKKVKDTFGIPYYSKGDEK